MAKERKNFRDVHYSDCVLCNVFIVASSAINSERSDECIDFTIMCVCFFVSVYSITSRNNASISNFRSGFRWKSEYPWVIHAAPNVQQSCTHLTDFCVLKKSLIDACWLNNISLVISIMSESFAAVFSNVSGIRLHVEIAISTKKGVVRRSLSKRGVKRDGVGNNGRTHLAIFKVFQNSCRSIVGLTQGPKSDIFVLQNYCMNNEQNVTGCKNIRHVHMY
ncbi:hypothetical protein AGLY_015725 [Aphis glycines]|uniref:Uncharacterized protein n=1 Tax=Aphis glycines TaxID=307491 RepID=A0A6G0T1Q6_APHGL|nr:hypothetical protein AGLY_015725 [Aphis glycines]